MNNNNMTTTTTANNTNNNNNNNSRVMCVRKVRVLVNRMARQVITAGAVLEIHLCV